MDKLEKRLEELLESAEPDHDNPHPKPYLIPLLALFALLGLITGAVVLFKASGTTMGNNSSSIVAGGDVVVNHGTLTEYSELSAEEKYSVRIEGLSLFPQMLGNNRDWKEISTWLAQTKKIRHHRPHDIFRLKRGDLPRIYETYAYYSVPIKEFIRNINPDVLESYWGIDVPSNKTERIQLWLNIIETYAINKLGEAQAKEYLNSLRQ